MKILSLFTVLFLLASCGFEPLYVQKTTDDSKWFFGDKFDSSITKEMAKVRIEPIAGRFGQLIKNQLLDTVTPLGQPENPQYKLFVNVLEKEVSQQALRDDITATRERIKYTVDYWLEAQNEVLFSANSFSFASYDILSNPYSTTMSGKKAEKEAASIIANDILLRLGAYFHSQLTRAK